MNPSKVSGYPILVLMGVEIADGTNGVVQTLLQINKVRIYRWRRNQDTQPASVDDPRDLNSSTKISSDQDSST